MSEKTLDFKKLAKRLSSPYWSPKHPTRYLTQSPEGAEVGPGIWFQKAPEGPQLWNLMWACHPFLDHPKGFTFEQAAQVVTSSVDIAQWSKNEVKLAYDNTPFSLLDLSLLLPLDAFAPIIVGYPRSGKIPNHVRATFQTRIRKAEA